MINRILIAIRLFIIMTFLTGIVYPLLITGIAQIIMAEQANGSLIFHEKTIQGSKLIGQKIEDDRYFWSRPSSIDYNPLGPSGGSNLSPTSKKLKEIVAKRKEKIGNDAPVELLYASGSGLDPHISLETAFYQIDRIAKARQVSKELLVELIKNHVEGRQFGLFGPLYVNVVILNMALDDVAHEMETRITDHSEYR